MTTPRTEQASDVLRRLTAAERAAAARHSGFAEAIRHSFDRLRTGLGHAHAGAAEVDEQKWADYVDGLDRGLDELDRELVHAADKPAAEGTLLVHASRLELAGWRLRFDLAGSEAQGVRERLESAESEVDRFASGASSAEAVRQRMEHLRTS
ncbi:hypothetical protein [Actinoplanes solisilvae]|uniref:hypothetical protein n=1 Tax=Actinoplanes solisilvae TaxID=2486853 RepID=UPI000FD6E470|nr:hypothetical protein [Actinoplanes solisilvae]